MTNLTRRKILAGAAASAAAHRRYQNGGWAREVTQEDFAISKDFSGVNMRLGQNGIRELHWHPYADEWQYWIQGKGLSSRKSVMGDFVASNRTASAAIAATVLIVVLNIVLIRQMLVSG
jgi:oxalate decarboxylase/phosphoglucose isomerase-like protein (cupin superfamily)